MNLKLLASVTIVLGIVALLLSLSGYPKLMAGSQALDNRVQNDQLLLQLQKVSKDTTLHLLKNATSYNLTFSVELSVFKDTRLENTNFYINCFDSKDTQVNCTNTIPVNISQQTNEFIRDTSRLTKTPLDIVLVPESKSYLYSPEFFGIDLGVTKVLFSFASTPYSRTNLTSRATPDLQVVVGTDFAISQSK